MGLLSSNERSVIFCDIDNFKTVLRQWNMSEDIKFDEVFFNKYSEEWEQTDEQRMENGCY